MPLEQMRQESLDARSDEWALASLAYEMLAGENPFLAPDLQRAEAAIEDAELVLPSLCWDGMDAEADDVLPSRSTLTARNATARWRSSPLRSSRTWGIRSEATRNWPCWWAMPKRTRNPHLRPSRASRWSSA